MLVSGKELLEKANAGNYAIGAFNFTDMENLQGIIEAAEELNAPVFIQTTQGAIDFAGFEYLADLGLGAAKRAKVPVALHLDHGQKYDYIMKAIRLGWTSIMMDASKYSLEENAKMVNEVIKVAKPLGITVEAEIGIIGGKEDDLEVDKDIYTETSDAVKYYDLTGCDSLAIAVGTAHGLYKGEVKIDFNRIKEIKEALNIPLVLHGSSGVPEEMVSRAVSMGINKVNFDTELKVANLKALTKFMDENPGVYDVRKIYRPCREAMKEVVKNKIIACGTENKSWL